MSNDWGGRLAFELHAAGIVQRPAGFGEFTPAEKATSDASAVAAFDRKLASRDPTAVAFKAANPGLFAARPCLPKAPLRAYAPVARNESPARSRRQPRSVSIVVTARNYGRYLRQCLTSCLTQTSPAAEVIYSDDASQDDSLSIARAFPGVTVIAGPGHTGVIASRNRGARASRGDVLIHVDGDDILPRDFVELHLRALTPETPFVYGPAQCFGLDDVFWGVRPWGEDFMWEMNTANTSSAIWRWAFEAAGGWQDAAGHMPDWHLFLRAQRFGAPAPSEATLLYRQHAASWTRTVGPLMVFEDRVGLLGPIRRALARLSVCCVYSGRLPALLPQWLEALVAGLPALSEPPELIVLDNSVDQAEALYCETAKVAGAFSSVRIVPFPGRLAWSSDQQRRDSIARLLADACNFLVSAAGGDLVLLIEDDVVPQTGAIERLFHEVTEGWPLVDAASGAYQSRHHEGWIAGHWTESGPRELDRKPAGALDVDFTGTGLLMFWRERSERFPVHVAGIAAHDWAWGSAMRNAGRRLRLLPDALCRHYLTADQWV